MNIKVTGKNLEITDAIRGYVTDKADRLEKFEGANTELTVVCRVEREDQIAEMQLLSIASHVCSAIIELESFVCSSPLSVLMPISFHNWSQWL